MIKNKSPLVTIVVPVYNAEPYLNECLSSLYNQTYKNIEIIIVDDGSTDGSAKIIDSFYKKNKKNTIVLRNNKPSGFTGEVAANQGISVAKGIYVARMDADDISCLDRIEKEVSFFENHPDYFLVSSSAEIINELGTRVGVWNLSRDYSSILRKIFLTNSIVNSSVLFRKSELKGSFYKIKYSGFNDYYTWIYYLSQGKKMHTLKDVLVRYRTTDSNSTRKNIKNTFLLSLKIKSDAVKTKMLRPNFTDRLLIFLQKFLITVLPNKIITYLYLLRLRLNN